LKKDLTTYKVQIECLFLKKPWLVKMSDEDDPVFTFVRDGWLPWKKLNKTEKDAFVRGDEGAIMYPTATDPWLMREQFFSIEKPEDALSFFREFGLWRFSRGDGDDSSIKFQLSWTEDFERAPLPLSFSELLYQRDFFESALSHGPSEWANLTREMGRKRRGSEDEDDAELRASSELAYLFGGTIGGPKVTLGFTSECVYPQPIFGRITCREIQDTLRATVLLDWMEGREWPKCPECKKRFKRTSKHPMIYCSPRCSSRARQREFLKNHPKRER
jgi:DNA-directed RNA polymerase subunit RPC12/RpoP